LDQRKINRVSTLLLVLGFGSAVAIYCLAGPPPADGWQTDPLADKRYQREMQVYGGKANLLSAEFIDWFAELWHGRELAFTVAVLTVVTTGMFRFIATPPALHPEAEASGAQGTKSPE